jgi:hypothetical protein
VVGYLILKFILRKFIGFVKEKFMVSDFSPIRYLYTSAGFIMVLERAEY